MAATGLMMLAKNHFCTRSGWELRLLPLCWEKTRITGSGFDWPVDAQSICFFSAQGVSLELVNDFHLQAAT
jgi:hypothetical protein